MTEMNPYGVGKAVEPSIPKRGRCECCSLPFQTMVRVRDEIPKWCRACYDHSPIHGESIERRLARAEHHEAVFKEYLEKAREVANRLEDEDDDRQRQVRSALKSRDRWKAIIVEVHSLHGPSREDKNLCRCGARWKCETAVVLDSDPMVEREANTSIYRDMMRRESEDFW